MGDVKVFPKAAMRDAPPPRIKRPCDYSLELAVSDLETQLGTVEAYNRLVDAAAMMKERIRRGKIRAQNPLYAVNVRG